MFNIGKAACQVLQGEWCRRLWALVPKDESSEGDGVCVIFQFWSQPAHTGLDPSGRLHMSKNVFDQKLVLSGVVDRPDCPWKQRQHNNYLWGTS